MTVIKGNNQSNNLIGTSNNDTIYGYRGEDTLNGKGGIDTLIGGRDSDIYIVDSIKDIIKEYQGGGSKDTVESSVSYTLGDWLNNLTLTGTKAINGTGNSLDNVITGNSADNVLKGGGGNDTLGRLASNQGDDGQGSDQIYGGEGSDTLYAGDSDTLYGGAGDDSLLGGNYVGTGLATMYGGDGDDTIRGTIARIYGGNGNDTIDADTSTAYGGNGDDFLSGPFESTLYGDNGNDVLTGNSYSTTGGPGADRFVFNSQFSGGEFIEDFTVADDTINVSVEGFGGGLTAGDVITPQQLKLGSSATDASDRFIYDKFETGALFFDVDGKGGTEQRQLTTLDPGLAMTNNDIFVVA